MSIGIISTIVLFIVLTKHLLNLEKKVKALEEKLQKVSDHVGLQQEDVMDSAVKLIKANRIDDAIQLIKMQQSH